MADTGHLKFFFEVLREPNKTSQHAGNEGPLTLLTGIVNDRQFKRHLVALRLERERKEAQAANAVKKPPATAKSQKPKKKRSA